MKCPACKSPLIVVEYHDIELDFCPKCKGFWFDAGEIELLPQLLKFQAELPDFSQFKPMTTPEKKRRCPRCFKKMDKISLSQEPHLILDRCPQGDGLWFDAGELGTFFGQRGFVTDETQGKMLHFLGEVFSLGSS